jgi:Rps23 Pro-64 3,4-dihydroxylase Tpa1-like proline 4-hydroxylase
MWSNLGNLSEEFIFNLNKHYDERKNKLSLRNNNNVKNVRTLILDYTDDSDILDTGFEIYSLLNNKTLIPYSSYILEYYENSFASLHKDAIGENETNSITTVTLLHQSDDLLGGQILIYNDDETSITILNQNVGEIISYNHRTTHGISKVIKGTRRVLVNWYNSKADNIK